MRVFIAALLPDDVIQLLGRHQKSVKSRIRGVKWENPRKFHVTLRFLGNLGEETLRHAVAATRTCAEEFEPIPFTLGPIGGFPGLQNPRVLYYGLNSAHGLVLLKRRLDALLADEGGIEPERREFVPHITMARAKGRVSIHLPLPSPEAARGVVERVAVMESLTLPQGSRYRALSVFTLGVGTARPGGDG